MYILTHIDKKFKLNLLYLSILVKFFENYNFYCKECKGVTKTI